MNTNPKIHASVRPSFVPAALVSASCLLVAGGAFAAPAASASSSPASGNVRVHGSTTAASEQRDDQRVCDFYLVAFNFRPGEVLDYRILAGPSFEGAAARVGAVEIGATGSGRTRLLSVPDGRYKLFVTSAANGPSGEPKHFKVRCAVTDVIMDPLSGPMTDSVTDAVTDPVTDIADPHTDPITDPLTDP